MPQPLLPDVHHRVGVAFITEVICFGPKLTPANARVTEVGCIIETDAVAVNGERERILGWRVRERNAASVLESHHGCTIGSTPVSKVNGPLTGANAIEASSIRCRLTKVGGQRGPVDCLQDVQGKRVLPNRTSWRIIAAPKRCKRDERDEQT